jgi:prolyl 4-hydroxylase
MPTMSMLIRFSPEFRDWMLHNLDRGCASSALVGSMVEQQFEPQVARALVEAFVRARDAGGPPPVDSIALDLPAPEYVYEAPRMSQGAAIRAAGHEIRVVARMEQPVLAVLEGVLSEEECEQLVALARPRLRPSTVVDPGTGKDTVAEYRDSLGMFFRPAETPLIERLERRFAELMSAPLENGEGLQVLRYGAGAKTEPHCDFLVPSNPANRASIERSGQRVATLIVYLNNVAAGGETVFPEVGVRVAARQGNGLYFEYANRRGQVDHRSLHAGAPVAEGEKWVVTKWVRERRFVSA